LHFIPTRILVAVAAPKGVRQLHQIAAAERRSTIEIFPQAELFRIRGFTRRDGIFDETVEQIVAEPLFALLAESIEVLHVHHVRRGARMRSTVSWLRDSGKTSHPS
jgi:hypothetical protein